MNRVNKNVYIGAVLLLSILLYMACADDDIISFGQTSGPAYLSIPEAQEFFENSFTTAQTRNVADKKDNGKFDPGEFTPQWGKAVTSQNANIGSVDIPLLPEYKYKAIRCHFENGKSKAYMVDITQKLVVLKSKHTGKKVQYILNLIPEKDYYKKHKGDMNAAFTHAGEKNGYSGLAVYTHIGTSKIISVAKFRNGKLLANVFLPSGKGTLESRRKRANALLDGIKVPRIKATVTRSVGEGEPEVFYCSFCGQEVDNCECWSVEAECQCGVCELCLGRLCPWCDQDPCVCDSYCPFCGYLDCICDEPTGCVYCGEPDCHGECWDEELDCGGCGNCAECGYNTGQEKPEKNVNREHTPKETDVIADKGFLEMKREAQKGNTCVPTIIDYILKNKGSDISRKDIIEYYENKLSKDENKYDVYLRGVPSNVVPTGIINFLGTNAIEATQYGGDPPFDYKGAIDRGNSVMTNIILENEGNKIGHNILVIGYTKEGNYIYIDPNYSNKEFECSPDYLEWKNVSKYDFEIKKK